MVEEQGVHGYSLYQVTLSTLIDEQVLSWHEIELLPLEFLDCSDSLS